MGLALEGLAWTAAYSEGSRRGHGQKTLVVQVAVVAVRLQCFAGMTASGCVSHVLQYVRPARSHDDDEPVRGVLTCGSCGRITAALSSPGIHHGNLQN